MILRTIIRNPYHLSIGNITKTFVSVFIFLCAKRKSQLFQEPVGKTLLENQRLCLLVFDSKQEIILQWIPYFIVYWFCRGLNFLYSSFASLHEKKLFNPKSKYPLENPPPNAKISTTQNPIKLH
jgi:hypothetical protein